MGSKPRFERLDGLRGVAAVMVLLGHVTSIIFINTVVPHKELAVLFFFMLSGFVLSYAYEEKIYNGLSFGEFWTARLIRLYPMVLLSSFVGILYFTILDPTFRITLRSSLAISLNMLCLPAHFWAHFSFGDFPLNPPEWSLFFEFVESALFAVIFVRLKTSFVTIGFLVLAVLYFVSQISPIPRDLSLLANLLEATSAFLGGIWTWRLQHKMPRYQIHAAWLAIAVAVPTILPSGGDAWISLMCMLVIFPAVISFGSQGIGKGNPLERFLGDISYPLYIVHWPVVLLVLHFIQGHSAQAIAATACILCALAAAWACLQLYDLPVRRFLSARLLLRDRILSPQR